MEDEKEDEISIDFSKIKGFFKRKRQDAKPEVKEEIKDSQVAANTDASEIKNDDEITIDLSKIKNIFKKKEKETAKEEKTAAAGDKEKEEDEISIDFSKIKNIKNIFSKSRDEGDYSNKDESDISVDFKKIADFAIRYRALLLLMIPIFLSIFLRVQPAYLPITDQWAAESVINSIRSQISSQISQQYPNLPQQNRDVLIDNELQKVLSGQKSAIDQQVYAGSRSIKSQLQDDSGLPYLPTIDPYYWLRFTKNIIERGHPGDEIKDNEPYDNHMLAPAGRGVPFDMFLAYFAAYLFKFLSFFNQNLSLAKVAFYVPVLISALTVIPIFFITKKIAGNFGGFIAATILAIHPSFLIRTMGGIFDTDGFNILFPLSITWIFLEALEAKSVRNVAILSILAGLLIGIYSFTWGGWWYIFDYILVSTVLYILYYSFVHKKELMRSFIGFTRQEAIKNSIAFFGVFFIVSAVSVSFFVSYGHFEKFYTNPTGFAKLKEVGITTIWPNVFTTVAEQNPASLSNVVDQVGLGKIFFFLVALIGINLTLKTKGRKNLFFIAGTLVWYLIIILLEVQDLNTFLILISIPIVIRVVIALWESDTKIDIKYAILLIIWFISTIYASTKGARFSLLVVPPFAIGFGITLHQIYQYSGFWAAKALQVNKLISRAIVMLILSLLLIPPYISAYNTSTSFVPDFNDAWAISLERIKDDSKPNAIVNSWWDFGHWFKYWADRPVTFDGTSQNTPPAHWIGKVLLTGDENLAIGILRMLDCGSREGFNVISKLTNDDAEAIDIMYKIMPLSKKDAGKILADRFNNEAAGKILENTHCQPPENYFITSEDMVGKSGVWAHFGSWDFNRALVYNTLKKKEYADDLDKSVKFLQERLGYSKNDAEKLFYEVQSITTSDQANNWIAPWPGYAGLAGCGKIDNKTLSCTISGIPLVVNLTTNEVYAESTTGRVHPKRASFLLDQNLSLKEYNESVITLQNGRHLGIALAKEDESYFVVAMDSDLAWSMFTRMFYQEGIGLKHFKKFSDERTIFGGRIIVWKVDWEGKEEGP